MVKKRIFISFDYEKDKIYKLLLEAWDRNSNFELSFTDNSSREIQSSDIGRVKAGLTSKINSANGTLVIVGKHCNDRHKDSKEIGYKNWQIFEIEQSKKNGNKMIAVKLDRQNEPPDELRNCDCKWAMSYNKDAILKALDEAFS